jgi:hypothetical protein
LIEITALKPLLTNSSSLSTSGPVEVDFTSLNIVFSIGAIMKSTLVNTSLGYNAHNFNNN